MRARPRPKSAITKRKVGSLRPLLLLGSLLLVWWLLPPFTKQGARTVVLELQAPLWRGLSMVKDLDFYWSLKSQSKDHLIEVIRDLARENAALNLERQKEMQASIELQRLEALLELPAMPGFDYQVARVYRRDTTAWWNRMLIGLGEQEGVRVGMGVVAAHGVVGRVVEVERTTAVVELVSSPMFRVAATLSGDARPVTYQGIVNKPWTEPIGLVYNVPTDLKATAWEPQALVSSHLGGVFPGGLFIGWVRDLIMQSDGLFQTATVYLPEALLDLTEVAVLMPDTHGN